MKKKKLEIFCTLGPSTLNKKFLKFSNRNVSLLRLNMSHIEIKDLPLIIKFISSNTKTPICIDTEGAQIRTKINKKKFLRINSIFKFIKNSKKNIFYPANVLHKLKISDLLDVGFDGLKLKVLKNDSKKIIFKTVSSGFSENNKGVHLINRKINLKFLTDKDLEAIAIAKSFNIKNYALSFTNKVSDMVKFKKILPKENKIYKIETKQAIKNIRKILQNGQKFLIDRGDLSKEISIEMIPVAQRKIIKMANSMQNKNVYVATNFLESMISKNFATRGEVNDIYSTLMLGSKGLVLAAETAIGKYPKECVKLLKRIYKIFQKDFRNFD